MFLPLTFTYHMLAIAGALAAGGRERAPPLWRCGGMVLFCGIVTTRTQLWKAHTPGTTVPTQQTPTVPPYPPVRAVYAVMEMVYSHRHPSPGGAAHGAHGAGGARNGETVPLSEGSRLLSGEEDGYEQGFKSISLGSMRRG